MGSEVDQPEPGANTDLATPQAVRRRRYWEGHAVIFVIHAVNLLNIQKHIEILLWNQISLTIITVGVSPSHPRV
jgi:hypothetical protein